MKKIGVLLSGCGVYDGAEIHESVLVLLEIQKQGFEAVCIAPNVPQHHVVNHLTGEEMNESRNVLVEAARIARVKILALDDVSAEYIDALVLPGGFGAAKNITNWAFAGAAGDILPEAKRLINNMVVAHKPIFALCMSPTTIAKALEGTGASARLTVGSTEAASPYEIEGISEGMKSIGAEAVYKLADEVAIDEHLKIITVPCYMMEASIVEVHRGIERGIAALAAYLR